MIAYLASIVLGAIALAVIITLAVIADRFGPI